MRAMFMSMVQDDRKDGLEEQIDENLRRVYKQHLDEDVPEKFQDLIRKLREQDKAP